MKSLWTYTFAILLVVGFLAGTHAAADDEFAAWDASEQSAVSDEFSPMTTDENVSCPGDCSECQGCGAASEGRGWLLAMGVALIASGFLLRTRWGRRLRPLFLLASLVVLGFGRGGCPCPIKGVQEAILLLVGGSRNLVVLGWFLLLIPVTYLFGRVWCGWLCHLGALQEFLYRDGIVPKLGPRTVKALRWVRRLAFVGLVAQLLLTKRNIWEDHDPFRAVFNLLIPDTPLAWFLLISLLVTSVLVYRPFCRTLCPIGLVLGWIGYLPGAARLRRNSECVSCSVCQKRCPNGAIRNNSAPIPESCIACGECVTACRKDGIEWRHTKPQS